MDCYIRGYKGKRCLDVIVSLFFLIFLSPLFFLVALAVRVFDGEPFIHRRKVLGLAEDPFFMFKFRSMIDGTEDQEEEIYRSNGGQKPINDYRVTRIGAVLRKFSLDELPQFANVLKGQMSLVGPRPMPTRVLKGLSDDHRQIRFSFLPGITGLAQITNRSLPRLSADYGKSELKYFKNCSLRLDCKILFKTIPAVISGRGT